MEEIQNEIKNAIDRIFNQHNQGFEKSLKGRMERAKKIEAIIDNVSDECLNILNNKYPDKAKEFAATGYISNYIQKKQIEFLGL